jgi:microcystin-dependent protein
MSEPFIGEIIMFAGNFAPRGWALCQGQILSIAQNTALFSILGTTYGGNGQTTFALPDFRGRSPVGQGQGPGLSSISLGQQAGTESATLIGTNIPPLSVPQPVFNSDASSKSPVGNIPAVTEAAAYAAGNTANAQGAPVTINTGGPQPFAIRTPYLGINFIIALEGIFPSRN